MERVPPHNLEAEQAVLAAVLLDNAALITAMEVLQPEDFYLENHRVLFRAMAELFEKAYPVDLITLSDHLQATGRLQVVGGPAAVAALAGVVSTAANIEFWAGIVKGKALLRGLITEASAIVTEAFDEPEDVEEFLDRAENKILEISSRQTQSSYRPIKQLAQDGFKLLEEIAERKGAVVGVPSGFTDLDKLTSGFQPTDLIIIAARPSIGKTALALNIMTHAALEADKTIAFFSLEMAANQLVMRMICSDARVPLNKVRTGNFKKSDWLSITNAAGKLGEAKIFVDDSSALSVLELKAKARRISAEFGLDMVIVDYLQLLRGSGLRRGRDSREQEIAEISRSLKAMAKELSIPVLALSQLNRAPEARESGEPRLADLRESGSIEQDADLVMMLHRPGKYTKGKGKDEETADEQELDELKTVLKIEKQRNGPTGKIDLVFLKKFTRFESYERRYDETALPEAPF
jgi:replicative DNA helicase